MSNLTISQSVISSVDHEVYHDVVVVSQPTKVVTITASAPQGTTGNGIESFLRISGDGSPGSDDVYRLTMTDGTFSDFTIHQGQDGTTGTNLTQHIIDDTPHPAYDDMPSLTLLFNNGLV